MRLHVFLARAGISSRRAAERLIAEGRVKLNGKIARIQGTQIHPDSDRVEVDGRPVSRLIMRKRYFLFHKPEGVVTTLGDPYAGKIVADFFRDIPERLVPAGRLDQHSSGLLLMTNDGELIHRLTHPRYGVRKTYEVTVEGVLPPHAVQHLEKGIPIQGRKTAPCRIEVMRRIKGPRCARPLARSLNPGRVPLAGAAKSLLRLRPPAKAGAQPTVGERTELRMILREGRKREIREMMKAMGTKVIRLHREAYGPLTLGNLRAGERRELTAQEVSKLWKLAGGPSSFTNSR